MLLIQEDREEHGRALRGHPAESDIDFSLPSTSARANKLLGFDSAGRPVAFGPAELPTGGDASGALVTPNGATTARALGEHLAAAVNVRDFGALGDGITDDSAAFAAAISAAQSRAAVVYVPASPTPYLLGASLVLDGTTMVGDGAGSTLKMGLPAARACSLRGSGAGLAGLRVLGPGASSWPESPSDVDLSAVALDGIRIASGAADASVQSVEVAACAIALAIEGGVKAVVGCAFSYSLRGIEIRSGAIWRDLRGTHQVPCVHQGHPQRRRGRPSTSSPFVAAACRRAATASTWSLPPVPGARSSCRISSSRKIWSRISRRARASRWGCAVASSTKAASAMALRSS